MTQLPPHGSDLVEDSRPIPTITSVDRQSVPEGFWRLVTVWPLPVTPLYADFWWAAQRPVFQGATAAEFALFQGIQEAIVVDGYVYSRVPASLTSPTPEQVAALETSIDSHHEEVVCGAGTSKRGQRSWLRSRRCAHLSSPLSATKACYHISESCRAV